MSEQLPEPVRALYPHTPAERWQVFNDRPGWWILAERHAVYVAAVHERQAAGRMLRWGSAGELSDMLTELERIARGGPCNFGALRLDEWGRCSWCRAKHTGSKPERPEPVRMRAALLQIGDQLVGDDGTARELVSVRELKRGDVSYQYAGEREHHYAGPDAVLRVIRTP